VHDSNSNFIANCVLKRFNYGIYLIKPACLGFYAGAMTKQFATNDLLHAFFVLGSALKCNDCIYSTTQPKEQQKCTNATVNCPSGIAYCSTSFIAYRNGTEAVGRGCQADEGFCLNVENACNHLTKQRDLKSCAAACCTTDNCNNYTPSSATGVMVTKFTLSLMVIVGLIFA
jgi:hypothetical protein